MSCGGCVKRRAIKEQKKENYSVLGDYKNLPDRQIRARLEVYKKRYCKACIKRYDCTFVMYLDCHKSNNNSTQN